MFGFEYFNGVVFIDGNSCSAEEPESGFSYPFDKERLAFFGYGVEDNASSRKEVMGDACNHLLQMSAMPADKDGIGAGNGVEVGFKEITYEDGDARSAETPAVDLHQSLSFGTDLKGGNVQVRELQFGFDGYGAGTETDIPERDAAIQFQRTECKQTDGSFGDHPGAPVQQFELFIGDSEWRETYMRSGVGGSIDVGVLMDNQAVGIFKGQFCRLLKFQPADTFPFRVARCSPTYIV